MVTVTGANFRRSPAGTASTGYGMVCRFGGVVVPVVRYLSSNSIVCVSPPAPPQAHAHGHGAAAVCARRRRARLALRALASLTKCWCTAR